MRAKPIYIVDQIGEVVARTNTAVLAELQAVSPGIIGLNYQYGYYKEVVKVLTQMTTAGADGHKYPLVWLYMPITLSKGAQPGLNDVSPLRIIFAMINSDVNMRVKDRYENNFKKILYPVYLEFMNQLSLDSRIVNVDQGLIAHTQTDLPYWGGDANAPEEANPFGDWVDIIEIRITNLQTYLKKC